MKPKLVKAGDDVLPDNIVAGRLKCAVDELLIKMIEADEKYGISVDFNIGRDSNARLCVTSINVTKKL